MSKYLLLRNNKQAGPYTLDEIREMALKAYDLVWVEGKSAAWRYPGEIEELKSFAPPVEEQPFDRFFKKPSQETQSTNIIKQPAAEAEKSRYAPAVSEHLPAASGNKAAIYINLPAETKTSEEKDPQEYVEKKQPVREKIVQQEPAFKEPVQKSFSESLPGNRIEPTAQPVRQAVVFDDVYSSPSDELNKLYAQRAAKQKTKSTNLQHLIKPVAIGFGLVLLLAAGIFIGLSINRRGLNSTQSNAAKDQSGVLEQQSVKTIPASSSLPVPSANKAADSNLSGLDATANVPDEKALAEKRKEVSEAE